MRQYFPVVAVLLFGVGTAMLFSSGLRFSLSGFTAENHAPASGLTQPTPYGGRRIGGEDFFGVQMEKNQPTQLTASPEVNWIPRKRLMLLGIISGSMPSAILKDVAADSLAVFKKGERIFGTDERLIRVERVRILLRSAAGDRSLELGEMTEEITDVPPPPSNLPPADENRVISRSELRASAGSADEVLGAAKVIPAFDDNGQMKGFQVSDVEAATIVGAMGIQAGDIIKNVNGNRLDSLERATEIWDTLKKSSAIHMTIERDGIDKTFSYSIRP